MYPFSLMVCIKVPPQSFLGYGKNVNVCTIDVPDGHLNPFMPSELFYLNSLDQSISNRRGA